MSYADNLLDLLHGTRPTARPVWTADLEYWLAGQEEAGTADPRHRTDEGFLDLCRELQVMPYYKYDEFWLAEARYDESVSVSVERTGAVTTTRWETPVGGLLQEEQYSRRSASTATTRFAVESADDLAVLRYIVEHRTLVPSPALSGYAARAATWRRAGGIPAVALPRSPLPAFLYEWAGVVAGTYLLADRPDEVGALLAAMEFQEEPIIAAVCDLAPPLVHFADNLSSETLTGFYRTHLEAGHRRRLSRLHSAGVRAAVHLDGTVGGLLPMLAEVGFDAIEAVTPKPAGDLDVCEMRCAADSDAVVLWGGVPGVLFSPPYSWSDVEAHLRRLIDCWQGTRFVVGVADQIPPDGDVSYCSRIAQLLLSAFEQR